MYHRVIKIFIAAQDPHLETLLQNAVPLNRFSHQFISQPQVDEAAIQDCAIIILDLRTNISEVVKRAHASKNEKSLLVGCFTPESLPVLAQVHNLLDQVWIKPFAEDKVLDSFARLLDLLKEREDAILTEKYLDSLIDSLPDLIWFKDARGAHLKVNNSFCRTVNKTKEQIRDRGHYYIWDIEPDEYARGEYVCLESEEIVLDKKETCLFDETVKCGEELRKFKTYKSPVFDIDGSVMGTAGFAHDVTDLQNLLIELSILIESLPFAVVVADKDRVITSVNNKFIDLFSLQRTQLIDKNLNIFIDPSEKFTHDSKWVIESDDGDTLLLSKNKVLKIHDEELLDTFGVLAGHIYLFFDITLEHRQKNKLLIDANTDHLTRLNNRRSLQDFMRKTPCQSNTALLLADLDNFKEVNDQYGHDEGDRILVAFSGLLREFFPIENLYRLGGDEFAIIIPKAQHYEIPKMLAEKLLTGFENKILHQFSNTRVSVSIGIALGTDIQENEGITVDFGELFRKADIALYDSKNSGKSAYTFWDRNSQKA